MKRVVGGVIQYGRPCVSCGGFCRADSWSGRCLSCWEARQKEQAVLVKVERNGRIVYRRRCLVCDDLISHHARLCKSCETRRRHKAGLMTGPPPHVSAAR